nr:unnamed protein product [Spirometra erinaceieuropaei]
MVQAEPRLDDVDAKIHPASADHSTARAGARTDTLTWFSPPVETVARGVAAEQSPATWSHSPEERDYLGFELRVRHMSYRKLNSSGIFMHKCNGRTSFCQNIKRKSRRKNCLYCQRSFSNKWC